MIAGLLACGLGLFMIFVASIVLGGLRKNHLMLRALGDEIGRAADGSQSPEERAEILRRLEAIEAQKRMVFGRFENAGG